MEPNKRKELETLVEITLDGTGIDSGHSRIDKMIPDSILGKYDPKDVVDVALKHGFNVELCTACPSLRVNGKWVKVELDLFEKASLQKNMYHSSCDDCYGRYANQHTYNSD